MTAGGRRRTMFLGTSLIATVALFLLCAGQASARLVVYWSNLGADKISYAPLIEQGDGADVPIPAPYVSAPYGTAIDAAAGKLYWLNQGGAGSIGYANLDGSGAGLLNTSGAPFVNPAGLAIDPAGGRIYWGNPSGESIGYARLDGSGGGLIPISGATAEPNGLAVDPSGNRIYWSNFAADKISYANLDGSGAHDLDTSGAPIDGPEGVAVDPSKGLVYWTNWEGDSFGYASVNGGSGGEPQLNLAVSKPIGVAIDPLAQVLYWGSEGFEAISVGNLAGCCTIPLSVGSATQSIPSFPVILESPASFSLVTVSGAHKPGSLLTCSTGAWAEDVVGAFYYRAPQSVTYQWMRNDEPIPGATGTTIKADKVGRYVCEITAGNFAGVNVNANPTPFAINASLRLKAVKLDRKRGTASLRAVVTGRGRIVLAGDGIAKRKRARARGSVKLLVRAKGKVLRKLKRTGKAKVKAKVAYTPEGGKPIRRAKTIVLKKRRRR